MVNIKLSNKHSLISDVHQWIITEDERHKFFYSTLEGALKDYLLNEAPKGSNTKDVTQLIHFIKSVEKRLQSSLNNIQLGNSGGKNG